MESLTFSNAILLRCDFFFMFYSGRHPAVAVRSGAFSTSGRKSQGPAARHNLVVCATVGARPCRIAAASFSSIAPGNPKKNKIVGDDGRLGLAGLKMAVFVTSGFSKLLWSFVFTW